MDNQHEDFSGRTTSTYLITGANSGLGFAICCRLIDEFLHTRPQSDTLHLLYTTRDTRKSEDTLRRLDAHLQRTLKAAERRMPGARMLLQPRVKLEGVLVDLTKLLTVKALAQHLLKRKVPLSGVVWNAGIAGWSRLDILRALRDIIPHPIRSTTYPDFMVCDVGALAPRQLGGYGKVHTFEEPRLGEVFTANVFGHYMLTHWLAPLMGGDSKVVWVSSISSLAETFDVRDLQGFGADKAYESSKRLTDLLVLTSEMEGTRRYTQAFLPMSKEAEAKGVGKPKMYLTHPGVVAMNISGINALFAIAMLAVLYLVRWIGSPWHPITPYKGAISAVYVLLSPSSQLPTLEEKDGKSKWGSACSVFGEERVARTEVEGWGYGGSVDSAVPSGGIRATRPGYAGAVTTEGRAKFDALGVQVWEEMERLRMQWEGRLGKMVVEEDMSVDA